MQIKINIDDSCKLCKKGLKYFKSLHKRHKDNYVNINMKTYKFINSLVLIPDYNSEGYLTSFHIDELTEDLARFILKKLEVNKESKKLVKLEKEGKWK